MDAAMAEKRERARDLAEEGLDRLLDGDETGKELIERAKKLDPAAVAELAEEVEREKEQAERFTAEK
jgi:predicted transcriptional regulator